jgi:hypothetical protein
MGSAVDFDQRLVASRAKLMDRSGDHLFAGSGFTANQHRTVALRHNIYLLE